MFTVVNRGAGITMEDGEQAAHALSGGLIRQGHGCGMLWGSALAAAARARRKWKDNGVAAAAALSASARTVEEFGSKFGAINCRELINGPLTTASGRFKYISSGRFRDCARMAAEWAPEAHGLIEQALLEFDPAPLSRPAVNCAVEAMKRMGEVLGLGDDAPILAAGFAGGLGLKGNACGALGAGIFALGLKHYRGRSEPRDSRAKAMLQEAGLKTDFVKPPARLLRAFHHRFGSELCPEIAGKVFTGIDEHSEYVAGGGCKELIEAVAGWVKQD